MPKRFDLIVFDWDGTLMDSAGAIVEALQAACAAAGHPVPSTEDCRYIIGLGLADAMAHILPGVPPDQYDGVVEHYRRQFLLRDGGTTLFPLVKDMMEELRAAGHLIAIATGKSRRGLDRALQATGLHPYIDASRCADEGATKPDPAMVQYLLELFDVSPERALMIGDTTHDLEMAQAAGMPALAVTYGAHAPEPLRALEPLACVTSSRELRTWLVQNA